MNIVYAQATEPTDENNLWDAAEKYGSVGCVAGQRPRIYVIRCDDENLRLLREDVRFHTITDTFGKTGP